MRNGNAKAAKGTDVEILLAEDNPADITSALNAFKQASIVNPVHVFRSGNEVLTYLLRTPTAKSPPPRLEYLLLLSLQLADAHGLDLLRKIKADERTRGVPVLILVSSQEQRGVMQSYKLGASACIVKPIDLFNLTEALAELRLGWRLVLRGEPNGPGAA